MKPSPTPVAPRALPLALTLGEPAGVGGELALKAWLRRDERVPAFFVIDDPGRLEQLSAKIGLDVPVHPIDAPEEAVAVYPGALPVLAQALAAAATPGRPDPANAGAVLAAIDRAVALAQAGRVAAVVTNPIHKATLDKAGFHYPGHTEYLAELAKLQTRPVMMLACTSLRVVPVTGHLPLRQAVATLNQEAIVACAEIVATALTTDFGIAEPVLAVAALNPHAGENGLLGHEESEIIAPAVAELQRRGFRITGPAPADTLFHARARAGVDAVICMYHDQALIPLKTIDFDHGVNITLGLPFIRTSPDHGTALDIAGTGRARADSLVAALTIARQMAERRHAAEAQAGFA